MKVKVIQVVGALGTIPNSSVKYYLYSREASEKLIRNVREKLLRNKTKM